MSQGEGKTALVTGGAGFIGSHLVKRLLSLGYRVIVVDNLSSGKLRNIDHAAVFHHGDITDRAVIEFVHKEQPNLVFHLAAQSSVGNSIRDPIRDADVNVVGTLKLLEAARLYGIDKLIYSSTGGALYGDPESNPCREDHLVAPISPYGASKYAAEMYLELYHRLYHVDYTVLRCANVYGPGQDPNGEAGVVAIFTQAMLEGNPPTIFGDGNQSRDFVYVDDVVDANLCAIDHGTGRSYNIGTGQMTTINQIFESLKEITGYHWEAERGPMRPGDVYEISLDAAKAAQELGWTPTTSLDDGLRQTVEYFRDAVRAGR